MFLNSQQIGQLKQVDVIIPSTINIQGDLFTGQHIELLSQTSDKVCSNVFFLNAKIGSYNVLHPGEYKTIITGNYCTVGEGFKTLGKHDQNRVTTSVCTYIEDVQTKNFKQKQPMHHFEPVFLGHNVWLGSNVIVKNGILIGHGAVIEDGTTLTKHVPPFAVVAGTPGKIIGMRYPQELVKRMLKCEWYRYDWQGIALDWTNLEECLSAMEHYISAQQVPLLDTGAVAMQLNDNSEFHLLKWTFEDALGLYFSSRSMEQVLDLPEIKSSCLHF